MQIYNTLSKKKEEFVPAIQGEVSIYACGITPYKPSHLGHAMQGIIFDVVRRYFAYKGYKVTYVRNYTDIDDKIINRAQELGKNPLDFVKEIIAQADHEFDELKVQLADYSPKVTENIPEIIAMIQELIKKGKAYGTQEGNVYFRVKEFADYGKLSRQKIDNLRTNTRKDNEPDKEDTVDFALWKAAKPNEIFWESPWGKGRPGWHIECSVMSLKHLGEEFDIHGGGEDLVFPHHENEIAQSESIHIDPETGKGRFAKYWMHNGLLNVDGQKMSKSLGNDKSISEMLEDYHPEVVRYMIVSNHYRSHINFVSARYSEANENIRYIYETLLKSKEIAKKDLGKDKQELYSRIKKFETAMDDDFNTVEVISLIQDYSRETNKILNSSIKKDEDFIKINSYLNFMESVSKVIGIFDSDPKKVLDGIMEKVKNKRWGDKKQDIETDVIKKIIQRDQLKKDKKYDLADNIRKELEQYGVELKDNLEGTDYIVKY